MDAAQRVLVREVFEVRGERAGGLEQLGACAMDRFTTCGEPLPPLHEPARARNALAACIGRP